MHKYDEGCKDVLERTMAALDEEALQMLLVTTQHSNILLCIQYAVERYVSDVDALGNATNLTNTLAVES